MIALVSAAAGLGASAQYLRTGFPGTLVNLGIAAAVLFLPLVTTRPLGRTRLLVAAAVWSSIGVIPGAYVYGIWVGCAALPVWAVWLVVDVRARQDGAVVRLPERAPFAGRVVWLTPEQGGRTSGPPAVVEHTDYVANGFVPPATFESGGASFVLAGFRPRAWVSPARGSWLVLPNEGPQLVRPGGLVVVTEGPVHVVAYFHVESVNPPEPGPDTSADVMCRNCGVRLRRRWGRWQHVVNLGPVACPEPEAAVS